MQKIVLNQTFMPQGLSPFSKRTMKPLKIMGNGVVLNDNNVEQGCTLTKRRMRNTPNHRRGCVPPPSAGQHHTLKIRPVGLKTTLLHERTEQPERTALNIFESVFEHENLFEYMSATEAQNNDLRPVK